MAYLKPPWFVRKIINKVAMTTGVGNSQTLTVIRRVSKQPQQIPVVVPEVDGVKYLVSTRGEAEWVKNVRADPHVKLNGTAYVASEVPVEQRAPIIAAYRPLAGKVVEDYFKKLPDDADHPTFALSPG
ncbi:nitroreductase family deazaflavin-dependent oxidoreductase [Mycolicibacterium agri]|nr:nitroreductase/quinone reductase family protein [Mycolicibacterium agri]PEG39703.1 nitroreductase family deazaflavin-dependent oxidoreductase [Mycolicibacterium agri]